MANDITASFSATETISVTFAAANPITAASQNTVNTGTNTTEFVNPATFAGASKWDTKINHALATAANDFLVASGSGAFVKKTLAETKTILDIDNPVNSTSIGDIVQVTQAAYDALNPVVATTLYIIID